MLKEKRKIKKERKKRRNGVGRKENFKDRIDPGAWVRREPVQDQVHQY